MLKCYTLLFIALQAQALCCNKYSGICTRMHVHRDRGAVRVLEVKMRRAGRCMHPSMHAPIHPSLQL